MHFPAPFWRTTKKDREPHFLFSRSHIYCPLLHTFPHCSSSNPSSATKHTREKVGWGHSCREGHKQLRTQFAALQLTPEITSPPAQRKERARRVIIPHTYPPQCVFTIDTQHLWCANSAEHTDCTLKNPLLSPLSPIAPCHTITPTHHDAQTTTSHLWWLQRVCGHRYPAFALLES